jgi:TPR repeat protein
MQLGRAYEAAKDFGAARTNYFKAADRGNAYAQNNLGVLYESGLGGFPRTTMRPYPTLTMKYSNEAFSGLWKRLTALAVNLPIRIAATFSLDLKLLCFSTGYRRNSQRRSKVSAGGRIAYPNLSAYVARGEARPAFRRAFDAQLAVFTAASTS